jgi:hypothetical protein
MNYCTDKNRLFHKMYSCPYYRDVSFRGGVNLLSIPYLKCLRPELVQILNFSKYSKNWNIWIHFTDLDSLIWKIRNLECFKIWNILSFTLTPEKLQITEHFGFQIFKLGVLNLC